jgi:hypothetical protein
MNIAIVRVDLTFIDVHTCKPTARVSNITNTSKRSRAVNACRRSRAYNWLADKSKRGVRIKIRTSAGAARGIIITIELSAVERYAIKFTITNSVCGVLGDKLITCSNASCHAIRICENAASAIMESVKRTLVDVVTNDARADKTRVTKTSE